MKMNWARRKRWTSLRRFIGKEKEDNVDNDLVRIIVKQRSQPPINSSRLVTVLVRSRELRDALQCPGNKYQGGEVVGAELLEETAEVTQLIERCAQIAESFEPTEKAHGVSYASQEIRRLKQKIPNENTEQGRE